MLLTLPVVQYVVNEGHLAKVIRTTRPSVSATERERLRRM
jgi:hypothetical protein